MSERKYAKLPPGERIGVESQNGERSEPYLSERREPRQSEARCRDKLRYRNPGMRSFSHPTLTYNNPLLINTVFYISIRDTKKLYLIITLYNIFEKERIL